MLSLASSDPVGDRARNRLLARAISSESSNMSIAGLKFHSGSAGDRVGNPLETKSGSYIYWGNPASFHDWKLRTELRIKLYDQAQTQPTKKQDPVTMKGSHGHQSRTKDSHSLRQDTIPRSLSPSRVRLPVLPSQRLVQHHRRLRPLSQTSRVSSIAVS